MHTEPFEKVTVEWAIAPRDRRAARGFTSMGSATLLADDPRAVEYFRHGGKVLRYWRVDNAAEGRTTQLDPADWVKKYATPSPVQADAKAQQLAELATLIGADVRPAADSLLLQLAESFAGYRKHREANDGTTNSFYGLNATAFMGERMGVVLSRLIAAEAQLARLTEQSSLWHRGELDTATAMAGVHAEQHGHPLPPTGQWDRDQQAQACPRCGCARNCECDMSVPDEIQDCTCVEYCDEDPATACSLSGRPHVHPASQGPGFGPCPVHLGRTGDR